VRNENLATQVLLVAKRDKIDTGSVVLTPVAVLKRDSTYQEIG
jgi:hypothetical protein